MAIGSPELLASFRSRLLSSASGGLASYRRWAEKPGDADRLGPARQLRAGAIKSQAKPKAKRRQLLHIETLEPRLLLSADLLPGFDPLTLTGPVLTNDGSQTAILTTPEQTNTPAIVRSAQDVLNPGAGTRS